MRAAFLEVLNDALGSLGVISVPTIIATSPAEGVHALDPEALAHPSITFWTARDPQSGELLGIGALKQHHATMGELKSMRTSGWAHGRGVAGAVLAAILAECRTRSIRDVKRESGTEDYFAPARVLYVKQGFRACGPFADCTEDLNSPYFEFAVWARLTPGLPAARPGPVRLLVQQARELAGVRQLWMVPRARQ